MSNNPPMHDYHPTSVESVVLAFARESLGVSEVSPASDLFSFEGASFAIACLTIQIEEHFDIEFPLFRIFEFPTLAALAAEVQKIVDAQTGESSGVKAAS